MQVNTKTKTKTKTITISEVNVKAGWKMANDQLLFLALHVFCGQTQVVCFSGYNHVKA